MSNEYKRNCPKCNKEIYYTLKGNYIRAMSNNKICKSCASIGKSKSKEHILKCSFALKGRKITEECKKKMSDAHKGKSPCRWAIEKAIECNKKRIGPLNQRFGKYHTEETKEKQRIAAYKRVELLGGHPSYNLTSCEYIDRLNKEKGWNLQHALNGGEISIACYSLDGYDKDRNIIFEYDENSSNHNSEKGKKKDLYRQQYIIKTIRPTRFLRYSEKHNRLYDALTERDLL